MKLNTQNHTKSATGSSFRGRFLPAAYIIVLGLLILLSSLFLGVLVASSDPPDFSIEAADRAVNIGMFIAASSVAYFLVSLVSAALWLANKPWAKHLIVTLAISGTILVTLTFFGTIVFAGCAPFLFLFCIVADIIVVRVAYPRIILNSS